MILLEEALKIVTTDLPENKYERIDFRHAAGRILAENIYCDIDMPPFNKAAVDGFACRKSDIFQPMELIEVIAAGTVPTKSIVSGCCSKIMTGAMMPEGADCVVMVEQSEMIDERTVKITDTRTKNNVALKGEDIRRGDMVLQKGTLIKPAHIAVLATAGAANPLVFEKVKITVLSTGDELVEPNAFPKAGQIRNSNASQLVAQAIESGANVHYGGIIADDEATTRTMLDKAINQSDVVILSGGVSMGDFDFVPKILKELGIQILFQSIAVQPGKPSVFGRSGNKFVFALPGNPVSSFTIFELLAKPFLYKLMGHHYEPLKLRLAISTNFSRQVSERNAFIPAIIDAQGKVAPVQYHGSAHINALVHAKALISVPVGVTSFNEGDIVDVRLI